MYAAHELSMHVCMYFEHVCMYVEHACMYVKLSSKGGGGDRSKTPLPVRVFAIPTQLNMTIPRQG